MVHQVFVSAIYFDGCKCNFLGTLNWFFSTLLVKRVSEMARKTMNARSKWKNGLFSRSNGLTSCRFFHEWNEWKNLQRVRPFGLEKRPFFHEDMAFIVLSANSITSISNNVEHECLRFSLRIRVYCDFKRLFFKIGL